MVSWIENELLGIPGLEVRGEAYDILRWKTVDDKNLDEAARLTIEVDGLNSSILLAGAIPYSLPTSVSAPLIYVPPGTNITSQDVAGKIVLRDFPNGPLPYSLVFALAYHKSADLQTSINDTYDRPSFANEALHQDMLDAGNARAAGIISMFDVPRQQIQSYFEPHFGTHYALPGAFVGIDEALALKRAASNNGTGSLGVTAEVGHASTRNVFATLPGISDERIILNCHTDGNTWVQDNGIAALLALAKYFAEQPKENRNKTLEFAFTTGHLHISKEGAARYADQLDREYDDGTIALVIAIEHMGTNEIVPQNRTNGLEGRELVFTGKGELMLWSIGPIPTIVNASWEAVQKRGLDRTIVTQGAAVPNLNVVPPVSSFGGIGTYFHRNLIPTTSLISGPWSLWAPSFGPLAIDLPRLRSQTLALADVVVAADALSRETLAGGYLEYRAQRAANASLWNSNDILPEVAPNVTLPKL